MWFLGASIFLADPTVLRNCFAEVSIHVAHSLGSAHARVCETHVCRIIPCSHASHCHVVRFAAER